jgi:IclR family transcriptional regulator, acetate operon repressor
VSSPERPPGYIQSVDRAIDILERLWTSAEALTLTELSNSTELPLPTVYRMLSTLERRGWVRRDVASHEYGIGLRVLGIAAERGPHLAHLLQPHLELITGHTGETANAAVLNGLWGVYIAQSEGHHSVRMFTRIGNQVHLHRTGVGKVLLAYGSPGLLDRVVDLVGLPAATPHSISERSRLDDELTQIRDRGYALDREEEEIGVSCVAVPVGVGVEHGGLALSVSGPSGRILPDERTLAEVLQEAARSASVSLSPRERESPMHEMGVTP